MSGTSQSCTIDCVCHALELSWVTNLRCPGISEVVLSIVFCTYLNHLGLPIWGVRQPHNTNSWVSRNLQRWRYLWCVTCTWAFFGYQFEASGRYKCREFGKPYVIHRALHILESSWVTVWGRVGRPKLHYLSCLTWREPYWVTNFGCRGISEVALCIALYTYLSPLWLPIWGVQKLWNMFVWSLMHHAWCELSSKVVLIKSWSSHGPSLEVAIGR